MKRFTNILCLVTDEEGCRPTLERAVTLAENNQARLTVALVVPPLPDAHVPRAVELGALIMGQNRERLAAFTAPYQARVALEQRVLTGTPFLEIIRAVLSDGYDLVIKPAEDPKFISRLFGSDDMHLLRKCPCPVWLTRPGESSNYANIMVAVDVDPDAPDTLDDELNQHLLEVAGSLALSDFAALHVAHVWAAPGELAIRTWSDDPLAAPTYVEQERLRHQRALEHLGAAWRQRIGADAYDHMAPRLQLRRGLAATVIPEMAKELQIDLVVMGTVGRAGIPGLLIGNTAEAILEQLQCSVLAIKPPGFISPVGKPEK